MGVFNSTTNQRITSHSNILIDNIFANIFDLAVMSENLISTISNHLPQLQQFPICLAILQVINLIYEKSLKQI